jgi:hypothetical protein
MEPEGADFYPDDGSVLFEELSFPAELNWRLPFATQDKTIRPVLLIENLGAWNEGETPPVFVGNYLRAQLTSEILLASVSTSSVRTELGVEDDPVAYSRARIRIVHDVPDVAGDQWRYLRMRAKLRQRTIATNEAGETTLDVTTYGTASESLVNDPERPADYDPENPLTWPALVDLTPELPSPPSAGSPVDIGGRTSAGTLIHLVFTFPRPEDFWPASEAGHQDAALGAIPGGYDWLRRYRERQLTRGALSLP